MRDPWIIRAVALLMGGICGAYVPVQGRFWILGILILIGGRFILWCPRDFFGRLFRPEIPLLAVSLMLGFLYGAFAERTLPEPLILDRVEIIGFIKDWNVSKDKAVGLIRVEEGEVKGETYQLAVYPDGSGQVPGEWRRIRPGDLVSFKGHLERPKSLGTPSGFDQRLYYGVRGLSGRMYAQGDTTLLTAGKPSMTWQIRQQVRDRLLAWESAETGVLEGILFGDSSQIPDDIIERYKVTGVLHVFAASGSNVAFVLGFSWLLFWFLPKRFRIVGTVLVLLLYAALCGGNAPIVRATILGIALILGRLGQGKVATLRWLFFAAVGLFINNPLIIQDLGFQLSFAAAWGIVVLTPRILEIKFLAKIPALVRLALAGTLAAQVATLPLLIAAFHRLSLVGFVVNVFILFILGSVLELGLIGVILSFSAELSAPLFQASLWLLKGTNTILEKLAELPYADVWVLNPGPLFWIVWYGGIGILLWGKERAFFTLQARWVYHRRGLRSISGKLVQRCPWEFCLEVQRRLVSLSFSPMHVKRWMVSWGGTLLILLLLWSPWNAQQELEVAMIDVGQGDALLILSPEGHAILLDAGPRSETFDAGERIVLPYLLHRGIGALDAFLITHEDADHIGGARAVLANIPTGWVGVPAVGERLENKEWQEGLPMGLTRQSEKLRVLQAGDQINLGSGAWLDVLGPYRLLEGTNSDPNNNSLVLKLNYLEQSFMLTADMEEEEMQDIFESGANLETDIFKVPHHGSRFSLYTPWLESMDPEAALISVGKNTFGHPAKDVLKYWEERHVPVFRTDEHGTIRVLIGEQGVEILPGRYLGS
ncbi:DNA internalization-related competence protein ComEC/Rec2 [Desulfosporosinus hippei]|uniref:Competence protein ComEC n=1 Tax=Desulfosporosinus hippei DSM 8344 TaxID=1121419 RepID=A0A1G7SCY2_9FIRM|nr:DNA internalization-related competence protein ComEC/Rec2 [Desulfosporosinus hippei]SDG20935.1 competence protein ComEC [Desulfosporosinus hippei DSM 8344]